MKALASILAAIVMLATFSTDVFAKAKGHGNHSVSWPEKAWISAECLVSNDDLFIRHYVYGDLDEFFDGWSENPSWLIDALARLAKLDFCKAKIVRYPSSISVTDNDRLEGIGLLGKIFPDYLSNEKKAYLETTPEGKSRIAMIEDVLKSRNASDIEIAILRNSERIDAERKALAKGLSSLAARMTLLNGRSGTIADIVSKEPEEVRHDPQALRIATDHAKELFLRLKSQTPFSRDSASDLARSYDDLAMYQKQGLFNGATAEEIRLVFRKCLIDNIRNSLDIARNESMPGWEYSYRKAVDAMTMASRMGMPISLDEIGTTNQELGRLAKSSK